MKTVATDMSPLKQFALPILCDMAHASMAAREELWRNDGVHFFLDLLSEPYWQLDAIHSIAVWLSHDMERVEEIMLQPSNVVAIIRMFKNSRHTNFENMLEPLLDVVTKCKRLNQAFGSSSLFVTELANRLKNPKAIVKKNLLKILVDH